MTRSSLALLAALAVVGLPTEAVRANGPLLVILEEAAPPALSPSVRDRLAPRGFSVSEDGRSLGDFWLAQEPALAEVKANELGIEFGKLEQGALVGAARFPDGWQDYRETAIPAGIYTLRYAVQPADGDHMGVSEYRDFLLLLPAADDRDGDFVFDHDALSEASEAASKTSHPAVLALFPIWEDGDAPQLVRNEIDQWTLALEVGDSTLGFVLLGHGEM